MRILGREDRKEKKENEQEATTYLLDGDDDLDGVQAVQAEII